MYKDYLLKRIALTIISWACLIVYCVELYKPNFFLPANPLWVFYVLSVLLIYYTNYCMCIGNKKKSQKLKLQRLQKYKNENRPINEYYENLKELQDKQSFRDERILVFIILIFAYILTKYYPIYMYF